MSQMKQQTVVLRQEQLSFDIFSMWIETEEIAAKAKPGQFISVYSKDGARLMPRPISICEVDREVGSLRLVYRVVGAGTKEFSAYKKGDSISILGPLGNGFLLDAAAGKTACLIGGGIGIPPMLELAKNLPGKKQIVLGYRDCLFLSDEFEPFGAVTIATEDGSAGTKGTVLEAIRENALEADIIYACGPTPMLKAVKEYAAQKSIPCYLSLEEKMACGIGACLACVCKTKEVDSHSQVHNRRICKDGPVFAAEDIEF